MSLGVAFHSRTRVAEMIRGNWLTDIEQIERLDDPQLDDLIDRNIHTENTDLDHLTSSIIYNEIVRPHENAISEYVQNFDKHDLDSPDNPDEKYESACLLASWFMNYGFGYRYKAHKRFSPRETREWLLAQQKIPIIDMVTRKFNIGELRRRIGCCVKACSTCGGSNRKIEIFYQRGREPSFLTSHYQENQS